jgi:hypothetical protein
MDANTIGDANFAWIHDACRARICCLCCWLKDVALKVVEICGVTFVGGLCALAAHDDDGRLGSDSISVG